MIKGRDVKILYRKNSTENTRVIAAARSCNLNIQTDTIEVCSPTDGKYKKYITSTNEWSVDVSCLMSSREDSDRLMWIQKNGGDIYITFNIGNGCYYYGKAVITSCKVAGGVTDLANISMSLQGSGDLTHGHNYYLSDGYITKGVAFSGSSIITNNAESIVAVTAELMCDARVYISKKSSTVNMLYKNGELEDADKSAISQKRFDQLTSEEGGGYTATKTWTDGTVLTSGKWTFLLNKSDANAVTIEG